MGKKTRNYISRGKVQFIGGSMLCAKLCYVKSYKKIFIMSFYQDISYLKNSEKAEYEHT